MTEINKVAIIGAGNFGFAVTSHLDRQDDVPAISLYDHRAETIEYISTERRHPVFYPDIALSDKVTPTHDYAELITGADVIILAVVSTALEDVLSKIKPHLTAPVIIVSVMKALDNDTGAVLTAVIEKELAGSAIKTAALVGGTTGSDLVAKQYLGMTLAAADLPTAQTIAHLFASPNLQLQLSTDLLGAQYASSFKNLISLTVGIVAGLGYNYGVQTHTLSLLATECEKLSLSLGAHESTFRLSSQCWGNDMIMSATGNTRNRALGEMLGRGQTFSAAVNELTAADKTAESANTLAILDKITNLTSYPILAWLTHLARDQAPATDILTLISQPEIIT